jgi:hypothetical protein
MGISALQRSLTDVVSRQLWGSGEQLSRTRILHTIRNQLNIELWLAYRTGWVFLEVAYVEPDGCQSTPL